MTELTALFAWLQGIPYQPVLVLGILLTSLVLFVWEKFPVDVVAMMVLLALLVTGLVPQRDILDGFSNPATVTVACMFVLSAGLQRTGVVRWIAQMIGLLAGKGRQRLSVVMQLTCGGMSAFINNTAAVAVLLPVAMSLARERGISPSKILMPLSFAAQFGGVCTLIGTSTNLLVHSLARAEGLPGFSMFEFASLGSICFAAGMAYMLFASRFLLPERDSDATVAQEYRLHDYLTEVRLKKGSPLIGQTADQSDLKEIPGGVSVLEIIRDGKMIWAPGATVLREGDVLLMRCDVNALIAAADRLRLENWADNKLTESGSKSNDISLMEVIVPNDSRLVGRTLSQLDFYWRYHAAVLGVRRRGGVLRERLSKTTFEAGDTLLLQGHTTDLAHLANEQDFILLQSLSDLRVRQHRALTALGIIGMVVVGAALGIASILTLALIGVVAMVVTRCLTTTEAYDAIDMRVVVLLAGMIPLGYAMASTGTARMLVDFALSFLGSNPLFALIAIYAVTMLLTEAVSNNATAVLMAPIAIATADKLGVSPMPFLVAITFAASTCFTTPVGYQTNTMIYGPGGYKYTDFIRVGLPLNLLFLCIASVFIPVFWPF
jgi:di/tricarboxylate transporter